MSTGVHAALDFLERAVACVEARRWGALGTLVRTELPVAPRPAFTRPQRPRTVKLAVPSPDAAQALRLMARDGMACWCGTSLLPSPTLWALHEAAPHGVVPYDYNGKSERNPIALDRRWVEFDHVRSPKRLADPGSPTDDRNLVTACPSCNRRKGLFTFRELGHLTVANEPMSPASWSRWHELHTRVRQRRIDRPHSGDSCCWGGRAEGFDHRAFDAAARAEVAYAEPVALPDGWP